MNDTIIDYTTVDHKLHSLCGDNAAKWAEAFCQMQAKHQFQIDPDLMLGWFANAIEAACDKRRTDETRQSEAVTAFAGWLTSRDEAVTLGAYYDAGVAADLVDQFNKSQGFAPVRDTFPATIKSYPKG